MCVGPFKPDKPKAVAFPKAPPPPAPLPPPPGPADPAVAQAKLKQQQTATLLGAQTIFNEGGAAGLSGLGPAPTAPTILTGS